MADDESDSERIAPVTYLFGAAAATAAAPSAGQAPLTPEFASAALSSSALSSSALSSSAPSTAATGSSGALTHGRAHNIGLHGLTRRNMSVAEMVALLESREIEHDDAEAEIARLEAVGLLDDRALAETLVRTLRERKGLGKSAIASELRRRAIAPEIALDALDQVDADDELNRAIEIARKRASQLRSYDSATAQRRLYAFLQRRGYSGQILSRAVDAALGSGNQTGPRFS